MAALVRQRFPDYTPAQVASYLKDTAEQRQSTDPNNTWGHGFAKLPPPDGTVPPAPAPSNAFTRNPAVDFNTLADALNGAPGGIWSDGTTMWVADWIDEKIYAYDLATKSRVPARDFDTLKAAGNIAPRGIWSDGTTMWVADSVDDKVYAYDMATRAQVPEKDFNTLKAVRNAWPRGIWSDGMTMWVADSLSDKVYAYDMATRARVPGREFNTLDAAGNWIPGGIWSDGTTMWVADQEDDKIYAYHMPQVVASAELPGAPTNLTATTSGPTQIDLSWSAPASDGGAAITGYRIEVSTDGSAWSDLVADTNSVTTTYSHTGLASGDTRHYRVSAINSAGTGPASNVASATTGSTLSGNASATRSFSQTTIAPGGEVTVTIAAANFGAFGIITETMPAGFSFVSSTHSSPTHPVDGNSQVVRFALLGDTSFTYTVTASNTEGPILFPAR